MFDFKAIKKVPQTLSDIVLSATQRKTPTVIRRRRPIPKIRSFYIRKIKFCSNEYVRQLSLIISSFPHVDDIHPFFNDLLNVLYDKTQYKIALGRLNSTKKIMENICSEYIRLVKYGTSLFACKQLKVAAFGKMTKYIEKLQDTLIYLEEVRQHLSRLPSIIPDKRTLLLAGFPNTGKSSFMNIISSADVDVQSYPFTTRSLFLGHFSYRNLSWQVIDSPGLLNTDLSQMNNIEMQSVTALAHINAIVLFFIDLSGSCGYSISDQIKLYEGLSPMIEKEIIIILSKSDLHDESLDFLDKNSESYESENISLDIIKSDIELLKSFLKNKKFMSCTALKKETVRDVQSKLCDIYLEKSVADKINKPLPLNKLNVVEPEHIRDKAETLLRKDPILTEKDIERNSIDYVFDERDKYLVENKYDIIPEIYNGKNIVDYLNNDFDAFKEQKTIEQAQEILSRKYDIFNPKIKEEIDKKVRVTNIISKENKRSRISMHMRNSVKKAQSNIPDAPKKVKQDRQFVEKQKKKIYNMRPKHLYR